MSPKEELPGVVFHIAEVATRPSAGKYKAIGTIALEAEVSDYSVWDSVVAKLEGLVVYSVATLPETLVAAATRRANRAEEYAMQTQEEARLEVERLTHELAFARAELSKMQAVYKAQGEELAVLRSFEEAVNQSAGR